MTPTFEDLKIRFNSELHTATVSNKPNMDGGSWTTNPNGYFENDKIRTIKFPKNVREYSWGGSLFKVTKIEFVNYGYTNLKTISVPNGAEITGDIEGFEIKYY